MPNEATRSKHRAMGWAAIGTTLAAIGAPSGVALAVWGADSHLWGDNHFLAGFAAACALTALAVYVLVAEFIGEIGPLRLPLPPTRHEREARRQSSGAVRVHVPKGRIPLHTAPPPQVSEEELARIVASRDPRFAAYRTMPTPRGRLETQAERGNALLARIDQAVASGYAGSLAGGPTPQVELQRLAGDMTRWLAATETLVKQLAPDLLDEYRTDHGAGESAYSESATGAFLRTSWELNQMPDLTGVWATCN